MPATKLQPPRPKALPFHPDWGVSPASTAPRFRSRSMHVRTRAHAKQKQTGLPGTGLRLPNYTCASGKRISVADP